MTNFVWKMAKSQLTVIFNSGIANVAVPLTEVLPREAKVFICNSMNSFLSIIPYLKINEVHYNYYIVYHDN